MSYVAVGLWAHLFNIGAEALQTFDARVALANCTHPQHCLAFMMFVILHMSLVSTRAVTLFGVSLPTEFFICECVAIYYLPKFT